MAGTSDIKELLTRNLRTSGIYIAFVFIILLFTILTGGQLLSPGNLTNLVLQYSYILILAIGMVLIIVGGHIDLSVGSVVALTFRLWSASRYIYIPHHRSAGRIHHI